MSDYFELFHTTRNADGTYHHTIPQRTYKRMLSGATADGYNNGVFMYREWLGVGWELKTKSGNTYRVKKFGRK